MIFSETSPYQRIVVTAGRAGVRLFLNGNLQFHSRDEYRYHEALVHPALAAARRAAARAGARRRRRHGGARDPASYPSVEQVTLVELDPHMTRLFSDQPLLRALNGDALRSPKLDDRQRRRLRLARSQPTRCST